MRIPKVFYLFFAAMLLVGLIPMTAAAEKAPIEQALLDKFAAEGTANFFVKMAVEADLSAAYGMDWAARGEYVWNALNEVAAKTQAPVIDYAQKNGLDYKSMLTTNSVFIRGGTPQAAEALASLPGVAYLRLERILSIPDPELGGAGINGFVEPSATPAATTDWGVLDTKADQTWLLGVRGAGMKVANIDTGVQYNHPALDQSFACASPTDPACWSDPSNICGAGGACDNNGHGTHTMGTMVGDDDPSLTYIVGMAPDATWIACKGCETNSCSEFALNTCADWIVAPGGNPANRPNVVNNSWGGGGGDPWYLAKVNAWRAAGVFPAFSAGNSGSSCGTLGTPGDYQESVASAAHDVGRNIASFSSRGPSAFGDDPYTKPNVSAPGVSVCSSVPTNSWSCGYSGTSMASPHTAGAVALIWSGCPDLVGQIDLTTELIQNNTDVAPAGNCGAPPDGEGNYTFGYGYLNSLTAVMACFGGIDFGTLEGYVHDQNGDPVEGASVVAQPAGEANGITATTDPYGFYTMELVPGFYDVTASKVNYTPQTVTGIEIVANEVTTQDFVITFLGAWTQIPAIPSCPDWTRYDGEFYAGTGKVYFLGGRSGADTNGSIYALDPAAGTCADMGVDMPTPISNYTINLVNNGSADVLCTFGGRDAGGTTTLNVQCYNPVANTAAVVATLPAAYTGFTPGAQAVVDNMVYVFGGFNSLASPYELARTDRFNPVTNSFTQLGNLSLARSYIDAAVVDGKIYAFGGTVFDGASLFAQTKTEVMADPGGAGTWDDAAVAELPTATAEGRTYAFDSASAYELAGKIVIAGGGEWPAETGEVLIYDVATDTYDYAFPDLNIMRRDHAGVFVPGNPGTMWVFGGRTSVAGYGGDNPPYAPPEFYEVSQGVVENTVHVGGMDGYFTMDPMGRPVLRAFVLAEDQDLVPLSGVLVDASIWFPGGGPVARARYSRPTGWARFHWGAASYGTFTLCVDNMTLAGYTYAPGDNVVTCTDWVTP